MADEQLQSDKEIELLIGPPGLGWGDSAGSGYIVDAQGDPVSGYTCEVTKHVFAATPLDDEAD